MMSRELRQLLAEYASELRQSKEMAERWWRDLNETVVEGAGSLPATDMWPLGPASHPWVIATFRKFYFACAELNKSQLKQDVESDIQSRGQNDWGREQEEEVPLRSVEPKIFAYEMLSGGEANDLYEFLLSLTFVPIGLKNDEPV